MLKSVRTCQVVMMGRQSGARVAIEKIKSKTLTPTKHGISQEAAIEMRVFTELNIPVDKQLQTTMGKNCCLIFHFWCPFEKK